MNDQPYAIDAVIEIDRAIPQARQLQAELRGIGKAAAEGAREASNAYKKMQEEAEKSLSSFDKIGKSLTGFGKTWSTAISLPLGLIGGIAMKAASDVKTAMNQIRIGTGATGDQLKALGKDMRAVATEVPNEFKEIGTAVADLNTRTGLAGTALQQLAKQELDLARMTGGDLKSQIASTTRIFGDWSIATDKQSSTLDFLFKVSQATGITVDALSSKLVQYGAPLRQMGFEFETAAVMIGKWEKEGVNMELVLGSMRIALTKFAAEGIKNPKEALAGLIQQIKAAGTAGEANAIALEWFGARAGPDMAAAIREGRFELDDLLKKVKESPETIQKAAEDTKTFSEDMKEIGHSIALALEPVGKILKDAMHEVMPALRSASEAVYDFTETHPRFTKWATIVGAALFSIGPAAAGAGLAIQGIGKGVDAIQNIPAGLTKIKTAISGINFAGAFSGIGSAVSGALAHLGPILPALKAIGAFLIGPWGLAIAAITAVVTGLFYFREEITKAFPVMKQFYDAADELWQTLKDAWEQIKGLLAEMWQELQTAGEEVWGQIAADGAKFMGMLVELIKGGVGLILGLWKAFGPELVALIANGLATVVKIFTQVFGIVKDVVVGVLKIVVEVVKGFTALLRGDFQGVGNAILNIWDTLWRTLASVATRGAIILLQVISGAFGQVAAVAGRIAPGMAEAAKAVQDKLGGAIKSLEGNLKSLSVSTVEAGGKNDWFAGTATHAATETKGLSEEMQKGTDKVTNFKAPVKDAGDAAEKAAEALKKLKEETAGALNPTKAVSDEIEKLKGSFTAEQLVLTPLADKLFKAAEEERKMAEEAKRLGIEVKAVPLPEFTLRVLDAKTKLEDFGKLAGLVTLDSSKLSIATGDLTQKYGALIPKVDTAKVSVGLISQAALDAAKELEGMKVAAVRTDQAVKDLTARGYTADQIIAALGSEIGQAGEAAKLFGLKLDTSTLALLRQMKQAEKNAAVAAELQKAWGEAMGKIVADFTNGLTDMLWEGDKFSFDLKGIFTELGKSITQIFLKEMFEPIFGMFTQLVSNVFGMLGGGSGGLFAGVLEQGGWLGDLLGGGGKGGGGIPGIGGLFDLLGLGGGAGGAAAGGVTGDLAKTLGPSGLAAIFGGSALAGGGIAGGLAAMPIAPTMLSGMGLAGSASGLGGTVGGIGSAGGGGMMGSLGAFFTNPWTIGIGAAIGAGLLIKKFWPKSEWEKTAKDVGRDFGIVVSDETIEQLAGSKGIGKKALEGIKKDFSSAPITFKEMLLPAAQQAGDAAVETLVNSFARLRVSDAFSGIEGFQKDAVSGFFDLSAAVRQAVETGDYEAFNEQWSAIFSQSQALQAAVPNWKDSLLVVSEGEKEVGDQAGEAAEKAKQMGSSLEQSMTTMAGTMNQVRDTLIAGFEDLIARFDALLVKLDASVAGMANNLAALKAGFAEAEKAAQSLNTVLDDVETQGAQDLTEPVSGRPRLPRSGSEGRGHGYELPPAAGAEPLPYYPAAQEGARIKKTGWLYAHAREWIVPEEDRRRWTQPISVNLGGLGGINIDYRPDPSASRDPDQEAREIGERFVRSLQNDSRGLARKVADAVRPHLAQRKQQAIRRRS